METIISRALSGLRGHTTDLVQHKFEWKIHFLKITSRLTSLTSFEEKKNNPTKFNDLSEVKYQVSWSGAKEMLTGVYQKIYTKKTLS